jgi:hypothetical protein
MRKRTNRVCIALVGELLEEKHLEELNSIKQIQMEENIKYKEAKNIYKQRLMSPIKQLEVELFGSQS